MADCAIFGIGNVLMGDDGVGPAIARELDAVYRFSGDVEVRDLGTPGLELTTYAGGHDLIVFVDAVEMDAEPGSVHIFGRDVLIEGAPVLRLSPHDPSFKDTLMALEFAGIGPKEVLLVGVVPFEVTGRIGLSDEMELAIPRVIDVVRHELRKRGIESWEAASLDAPIEACGST